MPEAMPPDAPADSVVMHRFDQHDQRGKNERCPACPVGQGKAEKKNERAKAGNAFAPGFELFNLPLNAAKVALKRLFASLRGRFHAGRFLECLRDLSSKTVNPFHLFGNWGIKFCHCEE